MYYDWQQLHADEAVTPVVVDSRVRLRVCLVGFVLLLLVVFGRAVQLEVTQGAAFRTVATTPLRREKSLPGVRGRILARDGTVLAYDRQVLALAVGYRYLEEPPDARWLRRTAAKRLSVAERKDPKRLANEEASVRAERTELGRRLARLCGMSDAQWRLQAGRVQARVERIAESVRRRHGTDMTVAEELDDHVMAEEIPLAVVARIESRPDEYPGVKIVERTRRTYPSGSRAAHVLGHLGPIAKEELARRKEEGYHPDDFVGRTGVERQYETVLRGLRGTAVELTNRSGRILSAYRQEEPGVGRDLILTIDPQLQLAAESLLDSALDLRAVRFEHPEPAGGAIVVMDVRTGALRAVASAPRFDPNLFVGGNAGKLLEDPTLPLFDRAAGMAIPPGSVFKAITAVALLETSSFDRDEAFFCQGYLHEPDRQRCAIYRRHGVGHDDVTLSDALAVSCNVFFFHHAGRLGPEPLADWARRFGFGQRTGVDLPSEAAGIVPDPTDGWRPGDTQSLAIGQGSFTATPMQVVRMIGAIANGGRLVTPHLVSRFGLAEREENGESIRIPPPRPIAGLQAETLAAVRAGLQRVVADPIGTAHGTVYLESIAIAGKTGTAETGTGRVDHAWFAGYAPAEQPRLAIVVVLEHSGDAATAAGPIVKALVGQMQKLGLL